MERTIQYCPRRGFKSHMHCFEIMVDYIIIGGLALVAIAYEHVRAERAIRKHAHKHAHLVVRHTAPKKPLSRVIMVSGDANLRDAIRKTEQDIADTSDNRFTGWKP